MNNRKLNVLILEDHIDDAELVILELKKYGFILSYKIVETEKDFVESLNNKLDIIISDYRLPTFDGPKALEYRQKLLPEVPFIITSGTVGEDIAVDCMRSGATDYVMKDKYSRLGPVVERALKEVDEKKKRRISELDLLKQENFSTTLVQTASAIVITLDINGNILSANKFLEKISGYKIDEIINKNWFKIFIEDGMEPEIMECHNAIFRSENDFSLFKNKIVCKDGTKKIIDWRNTIIKSSDDDDKNVLCVGVDITEQKHQEKIQSVLYKISNAISYSSDDRIDKLIFNIKDQLNSIIDTTNFYIALYDHKTDTITLPYFSDEKDKFNNFPAGKTLTSYVVRTKKSLLVRGKEIDKLCEEGEIITVGAISKVWLGVPLIVNGRVTGVIAVQSYSDENAFKKDDLNILEFVSEHIGILLEREKNVFELKNALEKAQESDKLKTAFLATMSHELRTPLNSIIGFSDLINIEYKEAYDYSKRILRNGEHLLEIIDDMFDISIIETGEMKVQKERFILEQKFDVLADIIKTEIENKNKKGLKIIFNPDRELKNSEINTDKKKFKQIFINLLKNAIKFTDNGYIEYGYKLSDNKNILFYVKDTGIGISKEKQKIIFERFRQIDDTYTRKYEGLGLGLAISKEIVKLLGGKMRLDSELGKGSTFYFTLPCVLN